MLNGGRFVRTSIGLVVVLTDLTVVLVGHVLPTVSNMKSSICSATGFTMEELYMHGVMMLAGLLLIHPQSLRELPALVSSMVPFGKKVP